MYAILLISSVSFDPEWFHNGYSVGKWYCVPEGLELVWNKEYESNLKHLDVTLAGKFIAKQCSLGSF